MYCPNCGRQIPDDSKFCGFCGEKIHEYNVPPDTKVENPHPNHFLTKAIWIGLIVLALAAAVFLLLFVIHFFVGSKDDINARSRAETSMSGTDKQSGIDNEMPQPSMAPPTQAPTQMPTQEPEPPEQATQHEQEVQNLPVYFEDLEYQPNVSLIPNSTYEAIINTDHSDLRLRTGPGTEYGVLELIPKGETVTVIAKSDDIFGWIVVAYGDKVGWVSAEYLLVQ